MTDGVSGSEDHDDVTDMLVSLLGGKMGMTVRPPSDRRRAAVAVAAYGIDPAATGRIVDVVNRVISDGGWNEVLAIVRHERLTGLFGALVRDDLLDLSSRQIDEACDAEIASMSLAVLLEQRLVDVVGEFTNAGIDHRVLKGSAYARLHYGNWTLRPFGDLDVMVPADDIDEAISILEAKGGKRRFLEPRPGYVRRFGKGACVVLDDRTEVDLHRTISPGPFGAMVDPSLFFKRATYFVVGGTTLKAPALEERLLHACHHVMLGGPVPRLLAMRDVAQILTRMPVDHGRLVELANASCCEVVIARAVAMIWRVFDLQFGFDTVRWAQEYAPDQKERNLVNLYLSERRSSARLTYETARVIRPLRDRAAFIYATLLPQDKGDRERIKRLHHGVTALGRSVWPQ